MVGYKFKLKGNTTATQWEFLLDCSQRIIVMIKRQARTKAECFPCLSKWLECFISIYVVPKLEFKWMRQKLELGSIEMRQEEQSLEKFTSDKGFLIINTLRYLYWRFVNLIDIFSFFVIANASIMYSLHG